MGSRFTGPPLGEIDSPTVGGPLRAANRCGIGDPADAARGVSNPARPTDLHRLGRRWPGPSPSEGVLNGLSHLPPPLPLFGEGGWRENAPFPVVAIPRTIGSGKCAGALWFGDGADLASPIDGRASP